jgi:hypothetical protein
MAKDRVGVEPRPGQESRPLAQVISMPFPEKSLGVRGMKRAAVFSESSAGRTVADDGDVFFGNVDWWYHSRGHSSTRTVARLARRVPTLYVNNIGIWMPVPGRTEVAWEHYPQDQEPGAGVPPRL